MINGDTNMQGNKEICHFLKQSIKQHVQMFPKNNTKTASSGVPQADQS